MISKTTLTFKSLYRVSISILIGLLLLAPGCSSSVDLESLQAARQQAKHHRRRVIMNNDGNDFTLRTQEELDHPERFLEKRTTPLVGSHVDSIFYCTGVFDMYTNPGKEWQLPPERWILPEYIPEMKKRHIDSLKMMADFCHKHDMEIFWSMRMNDTHDSSPKRRFLLSQWKRDHPECLVAAEDQAKQMPFGRRRWSSLDYGQAPVRDKVFRIFNEICTRYDVDGIEMDYLRHPILFREQVWGQDITQAQCDLLTDMMRNIRKMTEEKGLERGRPILIAVRVPDSVDYAKAMGIDLIRWLKEDLIDIIIAGDIFILEPWQNIVAVGHQYDVPVYACMENRRFLQETGTPEGKTDLLRWRGEALLAWRSGVDGIYTFNRFDPTDAIFRESGDPKLLETLDRIDDPVFLNVPLGNLPEVWIKNGRSYMKNPVPAETTQEKH